MTCSRIQANKQCIKTTVLCRAAQENGACTNRVSHTLQKSHMHTSIWLKFGTHMGYQIWGDVIDNQGIISDYCIKQSQTFIMPTG